VSAAAVGPSPFGPHQNPRPTESTRNGDRFKTTFWAATVSGAGRWESTARPPETIVFGVGGYAVTPWKDVLMAIEVVEYSEQWPLQFEMVAAALRGALAGVPVRAIEHVGSTSVPGLAAKPVIDIDVIVAAEHVAEAIEALGTAGYAHRGDLGVAGREAFRAPDTSPTRHVYVCTEGTLHLRNHLEVRNVLRDRADLRDRYATVKIELSADPGMDSATYIAGKSAILQEVLALSDLTSLERAQILQLATGR